MYRQFIGACLAALGTVAISAVPAPALAVLVGLDPNSGVLDILSIDPATGGASVTGTIAAPFIRGGSAAYSADGSSVVFASDAGAGEQMFMASIGTGTIAATIDIGDAPSNVVVDSVAADAGASDYVYGITSGAGMARFVKYDFDNGVTSEGPDFALFGTKSATGALSADGSTYYFVGSPSSGDFSIYSIDVATGTLLSSAALPQTPLALATDPVTGGLVSLQSSSSPRFLELLALDPANGTSNTISGPINGYFGLVSENFALSPDGTQAFIYALDATTVDRTLITVDVATGAILGAVSPAATPTGSSLFATGNLALVVPAPGSALLMLGMPAMVAAAMISWRRPARHSPRHSPGRG